MKNPNLREWVDKKKTRNPRVGRRSQPASHTIGTSFRELAPVEVSKVQKWYATGYFTQKELARIFAVSASIISKCCRCVKVARIAYTVTPKRSESRKRA